MPTIVSRSLLTAAVAACAACLDKDPLRCHPGRLRFGRTRDALLLATATRTGGVRITFRIPCDPGEPWAAVLDAEGATRLAKALRGATGAKPKRSANGGGAEIERAGTTLVVSAAGQRITLHAGDPLDEDPGPPATETRIVTGATDIASRIAGAMPFCAPADYRDVSKGPYVYLRDAGNGTLAASAVVATDGHRLFVDGDARDCVDTDTVLRVPGQSWPSAAKALVAEFETTRLVRVALPAPAGTDGEAGGDQGERREKHLSYLVFEAADREVQILLEEPQTSLPRWAGFVPRESGPAGFDIMCDKAELGRAVKAVDAGSRLSSKSLALKALPDRGTLRIRSADPDGGMVEQEVEAEIRTASDAYVHLNPKYVLDALGAIGTNKVRIRQMLQPLDPVRFMEVAPNGASTRPRAIVVMPVRGCDPPGDADTDTAADESHAAAQGASA